MTLEGIAENIIADILCLVITVALSWAFFALTRRARLLRFFGVDKSRRIIVYLSNLRIVCGGAIGIDNQRRSYQGATAAFQEMLVANHFRDVFNYLLPSLSDKPNILSKLLISDVQVQLLHSPLSQEELERLSPFITLGSPAYNIASSFVEEKLRSQARFELGQASPQSDAGPPMRAIPTASDIGSEDSPTLILVSASGVALDWPLSAGPDNTSTVNLEESGSYAEPGEVCSAILIEGVPPITDETYGFVERIIDHEQGRCVFYAAGISELATAGAAHFLATEWALLQRKYGNNIAFVVVLRFEAKDYRRCSIVFERQARMLR
jgi:hypothetical protein